MIFHELREKIANTPSFFYINQYYFPFVRGYTKDKEKYIEKKLSKIPFKKLLDFGCSIGHLSKFFPEEKYVGLDINEKYIKYARKKYPYKKFLLSKPGELPFKENEFDIILCSFTIHHIPEEELNILIKKFKRILTKNGKIIVLEAEPLYKQRHLAVKFIMMNDVGENYKTLEGWKQYFSKHFNVRAKPIKFGEYKINEFILEKL